MNWGQWHEGNVVDIRIDLPPGDPYPNDFKCNVEVRDRATGTVTQHKGSGKFIGNFSPIWIRFHKRRLQLTELERVVESEKWW